MEETIEQLRKYKKKEGLSYRDISARTGVNLRTIHDLFKGVANPTSKTIDRLKVGLKLMKGKKQ